MENVKPYFDKDVTFKIKGLMIIFMFIHHFFTFPSWYVSGVSYPYLEIFAEIFSVPFKICVPVFAFLTGYFYRFHKIHNIEYSIRKIISILIDYWCVYSIFLALSIILRCSSIITPGGVLCEAFGIKTPIMIFCWYISFYVLAMLYLPVLFKICRNSIIKLILFGIVIPFGIGWGVEKFNLNLGFISNLTNEMQIYFPYITMGYIYSAFQIFEKTNKMITRIAKKKCIQVILYMVVAFLCFIGQYYLNEVHLQINGLWRYAYLSLTIVLNYISIATFVYCVINLLIQIDFRVISQSLLVLGRNSMMMWFIHCIFFGNMKQIFQPILYFPKNPIIVLLWGLTICLLLARSFQTLSDKIKLYQIK